MCKKNILTTMIAGALLSVGTMAYAVDEEKPIVQIMGGTLHFTGEIVNAACAISPDSINKTINLGQYRSANFKAVGDRSVLIPFALKLDDCDPAVATTAAVAFSGSTDPVDKTVLLTGSEGIGIEISDSAGKVISPDGSSFTEGKTLSTGSNVFSFSARYKSTQATVKPGAADADVTFTMQYQ